MMSVLILGFVIFSVLTLAREYDAQAKKIREKNRICRMLKIPVSVEAKKERKYDNRKNTTDSNAQSAHCAFDFTHFKGFCGSHGMSARSAGNTSGNRFRNMEDFAEKNCENVTEVSCY